MLLLPLLCRRYFALTSAGTTAQYVQLAELDWDLALTPDRDCPAKNTDFCF